MVWPASITSAFARQFAVISCSSVVPVRWASKLIVSPVCTVYTTQPWGCTQVPATPDDPALGVMVTAGTTTAIVGAPPGVAVINSGCCPVGATTTTGGSVLV